MDQNRKESPEQPPQKKEDCKHERTKQERDRGIPTGDHICLDCGKLI